MDLESFVHPSFAPLCSPQYLMFPDDEGGFEIDDQYYIGDTGLLVKPAVEKDITSVEIYLAEDQVSDIVISEAGSKALAVDTPLNSHSFKRTSHTTTTSPTKSLSDPRLVAESRSQRL